MSLVHASPRYSRSEASELLGMVGGPVRPPLLQTTPSEREELWQDLFNVGLL